MPKVYHSTVNTPRMVARVVDIAYTSPACIVGGSMATPTEPSAPPSIEAEYQLEASLNCPQCKKEISSVHVVRILRSKVNFTSTLPRRGHVILCPSCRALLSAELGGI